jgi:hypothetical protein
MMGYLTKKVPGTSHIQFRSRFKVHNRKIHGTPPCMPGLFGDVAKLKKPVFREIGVIFFLCQDICRVFRPSRKVINRLDRKSVV